MSEFLLEVYLSRSTVAAAVPRPEDVSTAADQLTREGRRVRLLHSVFVPQDETRFYLFQAQSSDVVAEAARRCGLRFERLVEAVSDWTQSPEAHLGSRQEESK